MKITNPADVQINHWYTYCCHLDLYPITEVELKDIQNQLSDDDAELIPEVWATKREALLEIRRRWIKSNEFISVAEIDDMLSEIPQD